MSYLDQGETHSFTCIVSIINSLEPKRTQPMCVCILIFKCYHVSRDTGMWYMSSWNIKKSTFRNIYFNIHVLVLKCKKKKTRYRSFCAFYQKDHSWFQTLIDFVLFGLVWFGVFHPIREFFTHYETSPLPVKGCKFFTYARHLWPLSIEGSLTCHTYCDNGLPFIMVISEDSWHTHLMPSVWRGSCHYLF